MSRQTSYYDEQPYHLSLPAPVMRASSDYDEKSLEYAAQPPMILDPLNAKGLQRDYSNGERKWSQPFCDCSGSYDTFFLSLCGCSCFVYGENKSRQEHLEQTGMPHPNNGTSMNGSCCGYYLLSCLGASWILDCMQRGEVRERYQISGSGCTDCLSALCCNPCTQVQLDQELEGEERVVSYNLAHGQRQMFATQPPVMAFKPRSQRYH